VLIVIQKCLFKKCSAPLHLKSIQSKHEVKFQLPQNDNMSFKNISSELATLGFHDKRALRRSVGQ